MHMFVAPQENQIVSNEYALNVLLTVWLYRTHNYFDLCDACIEWIWLSSYIMSKVAVWHWPLNFHDHADVLKLLWPGVTFLLPLHASFAQPSALCLVTEHCYSCIGHSYMNVLLICLILATFGPPEMKLPCEFRSGKYQWFCQLGNKTGSQKYLLLHHYR